MTDGANAGGGKGKGGFRGQGGAQGRGGRSGGARGGQGFRSGNKGGKGSFGKPGFKGDRPRGEGRPRDFDGERKPYASGEKRGWKQGEDRKDGRRFDDKGRGGRRFEGKDGDFKKKRFAGERGAGKPRFERDGKPRFDKDRPRRDGEGGFERKPRAFKRDDAEGAPREERRGGRDFGGDKPRRDFDRRGPRSGEARKGEPKRHENVKVSPGRLAACAIGRTVRERDAFVAEVTPGVLAEFEGISPEDAAFATKIARGVTATLGTLDEFIDRNLRSPDDIQADVRDALRVSAYELLFLGKVAYAAVDQGVELVCSVAPKAGGLANAVLRKMAQSAKAFPFGRPTLSFQVLARQQAFPLWLAKRLVNEMGLDKATAFMRASNADAPVHIAVNALKANEDDVIEVFDQAGSLLMPVKDVPGCYGVGNPRVLGKPEVRALFEQGMVLVSDASAQAVAALACPEHDVDAYLEIGSGRGTKTILLQSDAVRSFGRTMPMVSVDDHGFKAELLAKRCAAYGIESVRAVKADGRSLSKSLPEGSFDAVLLDAPCSGVGTLRRHPEIRWRLTERDVEEMASVELDMLIEAAKMVKPGGMLVYATCTVFEQENEQVVERFLSTKLGEGFQVEKTLKPALSRPDSPDAHFAVRLRRDK